MKYSKYLVFVLLVLLEIEARKISFGGGSRRVGSSGSRPSSSSWGSSRPSSSSWGGISKNRPKQQPNPDHVRLSYDRPSAPKPKPVEHPKPVQQSNQPSAPPIGFDNVNKQTVSNQNSAPKPSAPIGFDNINKQAATNQHNSPKPSAPPIGVDNVNKQTVSNQNSAPKPSAPPIGFDNVNKAAITPNQSPINQQHVAPSHNGPPPPYSPNYNQNPPPYSPHPPNPPPYSPHAPNYNQNPPPYTPNTGYHPNNNYQPHYNNHPNYPQQGYHPYQQSHYGSYQPNHYGAYQPPGTNIHYGPVTYINGHQTPSYSYIHDRSDNTLLSLYVGYKIGQLFSHSHNSYFSDHTYHVHHYHHDKQQSIPEKVNVEASTIVTCDQNVKLLCIPNTSPVCMSNGTIMCVTGTSSTIPCKDNASMNCVESKIDCTNSTIPGCGNATDSYPSAALSVPCVSSVTILGDFTLNSNSTETTPTIANSTVTETTNGNHTTIFCVTVLAVPKDVNTTALPTPSPLQTPEIKEQASTFFGNFLDYLFT